MIATTTSNSMSVKADRILWSKGGESVHCQTSGRPTRSFRHLVASGRRNRPNKPGGRDDPIIDEPPIYR